MSQTPNFPPVEDEPVDDPSDEPEHDEELDDDDPPTV